MRLTDFYQLIALWKMKAGCRKAQLVQEHAFYSYKSKLPDALQLLPSTPDALAYSDQKLWDSGYETDSHAAGWPDSAHPLKHDPFARNVALGLWSSRKQRLRIRMQWLLKQTLLGGDFHQIP